MPCKHHKEMMIYAKQAAEFAEPWKLWQTKRVALWVNLSYHPQWEDANQYRQIPKTLTINGHQVPEPMREPPKFNKEYWAFYISSDSGAAQMSWQGSRLDALLLSRGLCHNTEEAAIAHAKALFSFSEVGL